MISKPAYFNNFIQFFIFFFDFKSKIVSNQWENGFRVICDETEKARIIWNNEFEE